MNTTEANGVKIPKETINSEHKEINNKKKERQYSLPGIPRC